MCDTEVQSAIEEPLPDDADSSLSQHPSASSVSNMDNMDSDMQTEGLGHPQSTGASFMERDMLMIERLHWIDNTSDFLVPVPGRQANTRSSRRHLMTALNAIFAVNEALSGGATAEEDNEEDLWSMTLME